jgi:hypothetical protein
MFAGFGYSIDTTSGGGVSFDPFYVLFGRNSVVNPERGGRIG